MTWNYRVLRYAETGELGIHEVYYEDGRISTWSVNPIPVTGETVEELAADLGHMADALQQPVLNEKSLEMITRAGRERRANPTGSGAEQPDQSAAG